MGSVAPQPPDTCPRCYHKKRLHRQGCSMCDRLNLPACSGEFYETEWWARNGVHVCISVHPNGTVTVAYDLLARMLEEHGWQRREGDPFE